MNIDISQTGSYTNFSARGEHTSLQTGVEIRIVGIQLYINPQKREGLILREQIVSYISTDPFVRNFNFLNQYMGTP